MKAVFLKEMGDQFGAARFPLIFAVIFMAALASAHLAGEGVKVWLQEGLGHHLEGRAFLLLFSAPGALWPVFAVIGLLGPLAGLLLGFDAVNRERERGTLTKILSQPVYRDQVIAAKFLAGLSTLAIMTAALLLIITGLGLAGAGLVPSPGEIFRLLLFWLSSVIYLGFWLGLALLMSILCRSVGASALATGAVWIFLSFFTTFLAGGLAGALHQAADPARPTRAEFLAVDTAARRFGLVSPVNIYNEAAAFILDPSQRGLHHSRQRLDRALADRYTGRFTGPLGPGQSFILVLPHLAGLAAWTALIFCCSVWIFRRQEVRSGA